LPFEWINVNRDPPPFRLNYK